MQPVINYSFEGTLKNPYKHLTRENKRATMVNNNKVKPGDDNQPPNHKTEPITKLPGILNRRNDVRSCLICRAVFVNLLQIGGYE
jgi:hypothetical protein